MPICVQHVILALMDVIFCRGLYGGHKAVLDSTAIYWNTSCWIWGLSDQAQELVRPLALVTHLVRQILNSDPFTFPIRYTSSEMAKGS